MNEIIVIVLWFGIPGVIGFWLARSRGKNPIIWSALSAVFPFFLVILHYETPKHEVRGYFRLCRGCGSTYPWKLSSCKYCGTPPEAE